MRLHFAFCMCVGHSRKHFHLTGIYACVLSTPAQCTHKCTALMTLCIQMYVHISRNFVTCNVELHFVCIVLFRFQFEVAHHTHPYDGHIDETCARTMFVIALILCMHTRICHSHDALCRFLFISLSAAYHFAHFCSGAATATAVAATTLRCVSMECVLKHKRKPGSLY